MGFKIRKVIVRVPTKEDWRDVVKQAIKDGCRKTGAILSGSWETYGDDSCICIEEDGDLNYGKWSNSKTYDGFDTYLITQEYLNKFTSGEITSQYYTLPSDFYMGAVIDWGLNKPKKTIMNTLTAKIKRIFSPSLQTQYKAGLIDNCGELTSRGREEVDMLVRDLIDEKLTKRAKEIIAEEKEDK